MYSSRGFVTHLSCCMPSDIAMFARGGGKNNGIKAF